MKWQIYFCDYMVFVIGCLSGLQISLDGLLLCRFFIFVSRSKIRLKNWPVLKKV